MVTVTTSIGITTESCGMLHHLFATNIADTGLIVTRSGSTATGPTVTDVTFGCPGIGRESHTVDMPGFIRGGSGATVATSTSMVIGAKE